MNPTRQRRMPPENDYAGEANGMRSQHPKKSVARQPNSVGV